MKERNGQPCAVARPARAIHLLRVCRGLAAGMGESRIASKNSRRSSRFEGVTISGIRFTEALGVIRTHSRHSAEGGDRVQISRINLYP
jgi:hypothetical protein